MSNDAGAPTIQFLGAAGTVTGSRFLLACGTTKVMVDCGMFQGLKELRLKNWNPLPIDPAEVDAVVLTHAHLDHCGYIPKLVKDGFRGKIHATEFTTKLAEVILLDSARIQTEDAKYAAKKGFSKHNPPKALYEEVDANKAVKLFSPEKFHSRIQIAEQTFVTFHPSGHILGAAFVEVEFFGKHLLFTGDPRCFSSSAATGRSDISGTTLPFGRSKWASTMRAPPLLRISRSVGTTRSMRVASVTTPASIGTLMSTRTKAVFPAMPISSIVFQAIADSMLLSPCFRP